MDLCVVCGLSEGGGALQPGGGTSWTGWGGGGGGWGDRQLGETES